MHLEITSLSNPRLKQLVALRRRRARERLSVTLVEGYEELVLALDAGVRPKELYFCPEFGRHDQGVVERATASGAEVLRLSRAAFEKVAYRESPDGWLAVVPAVADVLTSLRIAPDSLLLVCEAVEKPGNIGAILRTADAAGVAAVLAADPVIDWGNPNLVRASKGTIFSVPVASGTSDDVLRWLDEHAVRLVATTPGTDTGLTDVDLTGAVAIAVGSEMGGLSAAFLAAAQARVKIPMFGRINSLNVATAAAIAVYEAVRQRSTGAATM
ncbi:rRNA methyltransferase [Actinocatenispora thailandica]|uniref:rRNA methyltransferase n=1 Tax=Actinocatenispora thailandica TaxID=227318 RepID=A0A7R7DLR2_9ACTN|nr:RNA methyltransferase [Actinocatenispora thailandica]BCJ33860.1 rRNA methyltransferase [Actinocatenispora thailandica]